MKKLTWMIFIISKMKILAGQTDITETAILLFASIYWALILCPSDVTCALIEGTLDILFLSLIFTL